MFQHDQKQSTARAPAPTVRPLLPLVGAEQGVTQLRLQIGRAKIIPAAQNLSAVMDTLNGLITAGSLKDAAQRYEAQTGRTLHNDLQEVLGPWLDTRRDITAKLLPSWGPRWAGTPLSSSWPSAPPTPRKTT
jgi:hypothetical protein